MTNFADHTIWTGDNLDILRGLNSASVDLIYLDPPFNSNQNYAAPVGSAAAGAAFKDTWTLSDLDVAWMGLIADEQPAMYPVLQAAGLAHGKGMQSYLCMMAVRLLEMRRVLKDTGSIYLHCDPTASHYLKMLMDSIYGRANFHNEIVWKRTSGRSGAHGFGRVHDTILLYCKTETIAWNPQWLPLSEEHIRRAYRNEDERGHWQSDQLTASGLRAGESGEPWRGVDPSNVSRHWATPTQGAMHEYIIVDIPPVGAQARERIGYPTQKPLALLERIIKASSNEGDVVLDPFCGCATACVAAENLGRRWIGIDISPKAVELVNMRLQQSMGDLFHNRLVTARTDIPRRTDIDAPVPYRQNKHILFGQQEGRCNGCRSEFPFRVLEVDHIIPRGGGGQDNIENLQLLCAHCNRVKGDRPQEYLVARLRDLGIAA